MNQVKVLIVDDEWIVREWLTNHIQWGEAGITLIGSASSGREALELMEEELPHIVLTDITMPVMNGLELAREIQLKYPQVKLVFLTVYNEFSFAQQAVSLGAKEFLLKTEITDESLLGIFQRLADDVHKENNQSLGIAAANVTDDSDEAWLAKREILLSIMKGELDSEHVKSELRWNYSKQSRTACIWLGWIAYPLHSGSARMTQELVQLQRKLTKKLLSESRSGVQARIYPYGLNRLLILINGARSMSEQQFAAMLNDWVSLTSRLTKEITFQDCFLFLDHGGITPDTLTRQLNHGWSMLDTCFYKQKSYIQPEDAIKFAASDARFQADLVVRTSELFYKACKEDMEELVEKLTEEFPPYKPEFLIETASRMMYCLQDGGSHPIKRLIEVLPLIETIHTFKAWWVEMIDALVSGGILAPKSTMRMEVRQMSMYIARHYNRDIGLKELGDEVNLNATYAGKMFKREMKESLSNHMNRVRVQEARKLLGQTTMKVYEVAEATGFTDYRYFCKIFKQFTGVTPSDFKDGKLNNKTSNA